MPADRAATFVAYYRVSTDRQGRSGLGLQAQREAVARFLAGHPGAALLGEFTEVESGKRADRPQLATALALARRGRATLVIAKLDRLARSVAFIAGLMEGGAPFIACDNPHAMPLTIHMLAAVAQHEREAISARTKAALAVAKARGTRLGNPDPAPARLLAAVAIRAGAARRAEAVWPLAERLIGFV
jgi:DNA invertase Pin-like site-specific DNA recombinase